jgi:hypothetical protein
MRASCEALGRNIAPDSHATFVVFTRDVGRYMCKAGPRQEAVSQSSHGKRNSPRWKEGMCAVTQYKYLKRKEQ